MRNLGKAGILLAIVQTALFSQTLNTATTLKPGSFSLVIAPLIYADRDNDAGLYLAGGFGLSRGVDFALKAHFNEHRNYFGGDVEFALLHGMPSISLGIGAHAYHDVGLDATFNLTFPFSRSFSLYTGVDLDVEFGNGDTYIPVWVPIGFQVALRRSLALIMEIDIEANEPAEDIFCIGLSIFF